MSFFHKSYVRSVISEFSRSVGWSIGRSVSRLVGLPVLCFLSFVLFVATVIVNDLPPIIKRSRVALNRILQVLKGLIDKNTSRDGTCRVS